MGEQKKSHKIDRNRDWCKAYRLSGKAEKAKARNLLRHILRYGTTDAAAVHAYNNTMGPYKPKGAPLSLAPTPTKHKRIPPDISMERGVTPRVSA